MPLKNASWRASDSILEAPELDFGRFWDVPGKVLEGPGLIFGSFLETSWVPRLGASAGNCGQTFLPSFGWAPHL